ARLGGPPRRPPRRPGGAPAQLPVLLADAHAVEPPPALAPTPAVDEARWLEPFLPPAVLRTTVRKAMPDLTAHLFGELRVAFQDRPVEIWSSGRGRAVFEYLLVNHHSKVRRRPALS